MTSVNKIIGTAPMLVLVVILTTASADHVTWGQCQCNPRSMQYYRGRTLASRRSYDPNATQIILNHCELTDINIGDFNGLPNLQTITLETNNLRSVDPAMFDAVPKVTRLNLGNNLLLEAPVFGANSQLPNLKWLDLSTNEITAINNLKTFSTLKQLEWISLSSNLIESIHPDIFKGLPNLRHINLGNNRLTYIPENMFAIRSLKYIGLYYNQIEYIASGAFRDSQLEHISLEHNKLTHLPEEFVTEITRGGATLQKFAFYWNPWQCSCLLQLYADLKKAGDSDKGSYYNGDRPSCIKRSDDKCHRINEKEYALLRSLYYHD